MTVHTRTKNVFVANKKDIRKLIVRQKTKKKQKKKKTSVLRLATNVDESAGQNMRKFVHFLNKNIKLQLDSGSDLSIINVYTGKQNRKTNGNGYEENHMKCYRSENKIRTGIYNKCDVERENVENVWNAIYK